MAKQSTLYYYLLSYKNRNGERKQVWQQAENLTEAKKRAQDDRPVMKDIKIVKRTILGHGSR